MDGCTEVRSWLRCYRCWSQNLELQVHYEGIHRIDTDTGERGEVVDEMQEAAELPASGGSGVYVDLYGVVSVAEVIARLERALRAAPLPRAHAGWVESRLGSSTRSASVPVGPVSVERSARSGPPGSTDPGALEDRLAIFAELQTRARAPVVVVLDEFQALVLGAGANRAATLAPLEPLRALRVQEEKSRGPGALDAPGALGAALMALNSRRYRPTVV